MNTVRNKFKTSLLISLVAALSLLNQGCATIKDIPTSLQDIGPVYKPSNVYARASLIPPEIRRIAILPVTTTTESSFLQSGAEVLEGTLIAELIKTKRFEVIPVTRERMIELTGRNGWRIDEALPHDLFKKVQRATECDAVLFSQMTRYQPYQPLAIGWKLTLVQTAASYITMPTGADDNKDPLTQIRSQTFWSVDEVLDSGDPAISRGARKYYAEHLNTEAPAADVSTMASSPARFGQYSLYSLLGTLPERAQKGH